MSKFYEGADFKDSLFKPLIPTFWSNDYKDYLYEEKRILEEILNSSDIILEAGIGIGRLIPTLSPLVKKLYGIDNSDYMLNNSVEIADKYENVIILKSDIENLSTIFPTKFFDHSLCLFNTLGNIDDELKVLEELKKVTKETVCISVYNRGSLSYRIKYFEKTGVSIRSIDAVNETIYTYSQLISKSYSLSDMENLAFQSGFRIVSYSVLNRLFLFLHLREIQ